MKLTNQVVATIRIVIPNTNGELRIRPTNVVQVELKLVEVRVKRLLYDFGAIECNGIGESVRSCNDLILETSMADANSKPNDCSRVGSNFRWARLLTKAQTMRNTWKKGSELPLSPARSMASSFLQ